MSGDGEIVKLATEEQFNKFIANTEGKLIVVHFKSDWSESCKQMDSVLQEMRREGDEYPGVEFGEIDAEDVPTVSFKYSITAVPTVLCFAEGKEIERVDGVRGGRLMGVVRAYALKPPASSVAASVSPTKEPQEPLEVRLKKLVNRHEIMVFMKGNPSAPRCGFSNTLMGILKETGLPFDTFDILQDEEVRQGLKTFSNWQTYPQVYVKGELVGGLDIIKDLKEAGELIGTLKGEATS